MSNIYQDAIADARKLREVAEKNAKNRIIDVITPKLRKLIERELNEDDDEFVDDLEDIGGLVDADDDLSMMDDSEAPEEEPLEPIDSFLPPMDIDSDGFSQIELIDDIPEVEAEVEEEKSGEKSVHVNITVEAKNRLLQHRAKRLVKALSETKSSKEHKKIIKELSILRRALIISEHKPNTRLAKNISVILKESNMRKRKNWLFEGEDDLDLDLGDDAGGDEDLELDDEDSPAEMSKAQALRVLLGDDEAEEAAEEIVADAGGDEDLELEIDDDEESEEEGEEDIDDIMDGHLRETEEEEEEKDLDEIYEISESALRNALRSTRTPKRRTRTTRRPTKLAETRRRRAAAVRRRRRNLREGEAKAMAGHFGGGKLGKEMFVEVDEDVLLNALAEELGSAHKASVGGNASKGASSFGGGSIKKGVVPESRRRRNIRNRRLSENRTRRTQTSTTNRRAVIAERKAAAAQKELKESNLFNAKLLYVTKLMQQHTLNKKQQRAIVEAMDNANTIREAKLLFSSLTESLVRRTTKKGSGNLNESNTRTGNSSKSLRSSAPANSGKSLDRWAVLAGIKK